MKIAAIIQARLNSKRLPNKVFLNVPEDSKVTMLERVIERVKRAKRIDNVIVTTPDPAIDQMMFDKGIECYRYDGPRDVLKEYWNAANQSKADVIVRITADCPLIEPDIIDNLVEIFLHSGFSLVFNTCCENGNMAGDGTDVEVFSLNTLKIAHKNATYWLDREHVTRWMRWHLESLYIPTTDFVGCSVDTIEDYERVCRIYEEEKANKQYC